MTEKRIVLAFTAIAVLAAGIYFYAGRTAPTATATIGQVLAESGFTEFRPPSQHALPGTLVVVAASRPSALNVNCRPKQFLGIDPQAIPVSPSISTDLSAALDRTLSVDASLLQKLTAAGRLSPVENISIRLRNVRLLELSDDVVVSGVADRSPACREALELRLASGGAVTMIKAALMADVTYVATTESRGEISTDLKDTLASALNAHVTGSGNGRVELAGEALIWGIRDDEVLARIGTTRPAGATETGGRSLLAAGAVIEELEVNDAAALARP